MNRTQKRQVYTPHIIRSKILSTLETAKHLKISINSDHYIRISKNTNSMSELNNILESLRNKIKNTILTTKPSFFQILLIRIKRLFR